MNVISSSTNEVLGTSEVMISMMQTDIFQICQILYEKRNYILNSCNIEEVV